MTTFTTPTKKIKSIYKGDPDFYIDNGFTMAPRAGLEISKKCPNSYKSMIETCVQMGWLQPVAYMKESEYVWEKIGD